MRSLRSGMGLLVGIALLAPDLSAAPIVLPPGPMFFRLGTGDYRSYGILSFHGDLLFCPSCNTCTDFSGMCNLTDPVSVSGTAGCVGAPGPSNLVVIWRLETVALPEVAAAVTIPVRLSSLRFPVASFSAPCNAPWAARIVIEESEGEMTIRRHDESGGSFDLAFELHANLEFGWMRWGDFDPSFTYRVGPYSVTANDVPWRVGALTPEVPVGVCPECVGGFAVGSGRLQGSGTTPAEKRSGLHVYLDRDTFALPIAAACVVDDGTGVAGAGWSAIKQLYR